MAIILKKGREKAIQNRHHWIFSGAVHKVQGVNDGDITQVFSHDRVLLGQAYVNSQSKIFARMISFCDEDALDSVYRNLRQAAAMRKDLIDEESTNCYRVINGEGDHIPGLIVDKYGDYLALQISTLGMDKLKKQVIQQLVEIYAPKGIYEKSMLPSRKEEKLPPEEGVLYGDIPDMVTVLENGLKYVVDLKKGQKTGMFLDHRNMRKHISGLAHGKKVLNCFSYSGGFSIAAMAGGAVQVDSVDISESAISLAEHNAEINGNDLAKHNFFAEDVFNFLREKTIDYDIVILDPPAFAKKRSDVVRACRGYKDINRITLEGMPPSSILLTCSCSYHVDEQLFRQVVFQSAAEAKREVKIIGKHFLAEDHPINIYHPEGDYLKSFILYVV
ncbi:MAG: class I SAM-dependent rRNA methyltransferase [Chlamydiota bacterium]|nr:class I SAM-dependent rRNA methyltransferase [Chlamydiota bacterium]